IVAMIVALIIAGISGTGTGFPIGELKKVEIKPPPKLVNVGLAIIPTNPIESLAKGDILPIIFLPSSLEYRLQQQVRRLNP
ncbi:MAG: hypothetical protein ACUVTN_02930, partial [Thermodesulfobacteriota bacterium]